MTRRSAESSGEVEPNTMPSWDCWSEPWNTSAAYESSASWLVTRSAPLLASCSLARCSLARATASFWATASLWARALASAAMARASVASAATWAAWARAWAACAEATRCWATGSAALVRWRLTYARASEAFVPSSCWPSAAILWSLRFFWSETESACATKAVPTEAVHARTSPAAVSLVAGPLSMERLFSHIWTIGTTGHSGWGEFGMMVAFASSCLAAGKAGPTPGAAALDGTGNRMRRRRGARGRNRKIWQFPGGSDAQVAPQRHPRGETRQPDHPDDDEGRDVEDVGHADEGRVGQGLAEEADDAVAHRRPQHAHRQDRAEHARQHRLHHEGEADGEVRRAHEPHDACLPPPAEGGLTDRGGDQHDGGEHHQRGQRDGCPGDGVHEGEELLEELLLVLDVRHPGHALDRAGDDVELAGVVEVHPVGV